jgi:hypothetical protein
MCFVVVEGKDINKIYILKFFCNYFLHIFALNNKQINIMEDLLYFALFWILAGLGNYLVFLVELKVKGIKCPKSFKRKVFWSVLSWGIIGVIISFFTLIFNKKW